MNCVFLTTETPPHFLKTTVVNKTETGKAKDLQKIDS
jgi:hypothetical protein